MSRHHQPSSPTRFIAVVTGELPAPAGLDAAGRQDFFPTVAAEAAAAVQQQQQHHRHHHTQGTAKPSRDNRKPPPPSPPPPSPAPAAAAATSAASASSQHGVGGAPAVAASTSSMTMKAKRKLLRQLQRERARLARELDERQRRRALPSSSSSSSWMSATSPAAAADISTSRDHDKRQKRHHNASSYSTSDLWGGALSATQQQQQQGIKKKPPPEEEQQQQQQQSSNGTSAVPPPTVRDDEDALQRRLLTNAERLCSGITMFQPAEDEGDQNGIGIRLDIMIDGEHVACHHVCFGLVVATYIDVSVAAGAKKKKKKAATTADPSQVNDDGYLCLRLVQHTIPRGVPLTKIVRATMMGGGGIGLMGSDTTDTPPCVIGPLNDPSKWKVAALQRQLQTCATQLHRACYCYYLRKKDYRRLRDLMILSKHYKNNNTAGDIDMDTHCVYSISHVTAARNTVDWISFRLRMKDDDGGSDHHNDGNNNGDNDAATVERRLSFRIKLEYQDPFQTLPTDVTIRPKMKKRRHDSNSIDGSNNDNNVKKNNDGSGAMDETPLLDENTSDEVISDLISTVSSLLYRFPVLRAIEEMGKVLDGFDNSDEEEYGAGDDGGDEDDGDGD